MNCLGLSWLPECAYEPLAPGFTYFSIGEGVAALSLLLLIPQFMKPIYKFRLRMRILDEPHIYYIAVTAFLFIIIAAVIPLMPTISWPFVGWPVFWEILGGLGFLVSYIALAAAYLFPVRVKKRKAEKFAQNAAWFLAHAAPADRVDFVPEIRTNTGKLLEISRLVDFEKARDDAIYHFRRRQDMDEASYSWSILDILADPAFCRTLVDRCPWDVSTIVEICHQKGVGSAAGSLFIQELARQAILSDDSVFQRETDTAGFGVARVLTDTFFGNHRRNNAVRPFNGLWYDDFDVNNEQLIRRLNLAATTSLETIFQARGELDAKNIYDLADCYEIISIKSRSEDAPKNRPVASALGSGVEKIIDATRAHLAGLPPEDRRQFYGPAEDAERINAFHRNVFDAVARLTMHFWGSIANHFDGINDEHWHTAQYTWKAVFPKHGDYPNGMDPLQQRIAIMLRGKIENNMQGMFPAFTRLCLSMIGPFNEPGLHNPNSAFGLVQNDFYFRIRNMKRLATEEPDKILKLLPPNVSFENATETLVHTYTSGTQARTVLPELKLEPISFAAEDVAE